MDHRHGEKSYSQWQQKRKVAQRDKVITHPRGLSIYREPSTLHTPDNLGMGEHYNPSTWEVQGGELEVHGHLCKCSDLEANLVRLSLRAKEKSLDLVLECLVIPQQVA